MAIYARDDIWYGFLVRRATQSRDLRGPGWSGFGECAQEFLRQVDLANLRGRGLGPQLDSLTSDLVARWEGIAGPTGNNAWGIARKAINVFLIDAVHHVQFQHTFEEGLSEQLELPLDRQVANGLLRALRPGNHWPRGQGVSFPGVAHLDATTNRAWQALGQQVADSLGLSRAELGVALADGLEFELDDAEREESENAIELVRAV